jgi:hypothetical protein
MGTGRDIRVCIGVGIGVGIGNGKRKYGWSHNCRSELLECSLNWWCYSSS